MLFNKSWLLCRVTFVLPLLLSLLPCLSIVAQPKNSPIDSLQNLLAKHPQKDTTRVKLLLSLTEFTVDDHKQKRVIAEEARVLSKELKYEIGEASALVHIGVSYRLGGDLTQALHYGKQALELPVGKRDDRIRAMALNLIAVAHKLQGNLPEALRNYLEALNAAERSGVKKQIANALLNIGNAYATLDDLPQALSYQFKSLKLWEEMGDQLRASISLNNIGEAYRLMSDYPKAIDYYQRSLIISKDIGYRDGQAVSESNLADVYQKTGEYKKALALAHPTLAAVKELEDPELISWCSDILARVHLQTGREDSALIYGLQALHVAKEAGMKEYIRDASLVLSKAYATQKDFSNAYRYQQLYSTYKDSLANETTRTQISKLQLDYELDKKEASIALLTKDKILQAEKSRRQQQLISAFVVGLILVVLLAVVLWRSNNNKQRANTILKQQKQEIDLQAKHLRELNEELNKQKGQVEVQRDKLQVQRDHLDTTLQQLRAAQSQLVQSEKMASLGELTAGIAHEIQNPLNFVNNFSEANQDLITELEVEAQNGNLQAITAIAAELKENGKRITHHGKRTDSIVKSMMQHSRRAKGAKEPTDINRLTEEYLRLAYHGFRAKDSRFSVILETHYDPAAGKVNVLPQDIGRVLLNLFNNAFYAVLRKKQLYPEYEPTVSVRTRRKGNKIVVTVKDNGTGIPKQIMNKVFQPFFTTKPTGEGTGLGLSLSYDVVTKGHGGHLSVQSVEGELTEFTVELPV
ncbi:MAG TPA: tetratricopeptide repeat protein [Chitinophagaceae bacterium]|nr:tetratricopeptide repeat protein [Chitinophagaceae bacterium]